MSGNRPTSSSATTAPKGNVAGIEIENSTGADVYGNTATGNTGGILVFNMPNLPVPGSKTRVFKNKVTANNHANFGAAGSAVSSVPPGSGIIVNSNDLVEIFDNDIADNQTANVIISSYYSTGFDTKKGVAAAYDPFPQNIYVTGNRFVGGGTNPGTKYAPLKALAGGALPAVLWDGFVDPKVPNAGICVQNGDAKLLNADGPHKFAGARIDTAVDCAPADAAARDQAARQHDEGKMIARLLALAGGAAVRRRVPASGGDRGDVHRRRAIRKSCPTGGCSPSPTGGSRRTRGW